MKRLLFKKSVGDKLRQDKLPSVYLVYFPNCFFRRRQTGFHTKKENINKWQKSQKNLLKSFPNLPPCFFSRENRPLNFFPPIEIRSKNRPRLSFLFLSAWQRWAGPAARKENPWKINSSEFVIVQKRPSYCPSVSTFFSFRFHFFLLLEPRLSSFTFWDENADFYIFLRWFFSPFSGEQRCVLLLGNLIISP